MKTNVDSLVGERAVLTEDADSMKQTEKPAKRSGVDSQTAGRDPGHKKRRAYRGSKDKRVKLIVKG